MVNNKTLIFVAVLAVAFAALNSYIVMQKASQIAQANQLTGLTGSEGYVNVTVAVGISVNFTKDAVSWGVGSINGGESNVTLVVADGTGTSVTRGNWSTTGITPLSIVNLGNVNATLSLSTTKNATTLFGGSAGHRAYRWNITNSDSGSCNPTAFSNATFIDVNTSGYSFCSQFGFVDSQDQVNISILLTVPYDGNTGALTDTITATVAAA